MNKLKMLGKSDKVLPIRGESFRHCFYMVRVFYKLPDGRISFRWAQRYDWESHYRCIEVGHDPGEGIVVKSIVNGHFRGVLPATTHLARKDAIK